MPDGEGHPDLSEMELGTILAALSDPVRRCVVRTLTELPDGAERHCSSFGLAVSKATRTHHFRILREAGLIQQLDRGNSRMARLRRADVERRFPGLLALIRADQSLP